MSSKDIFDQAAEEDGDIFERASREMVKTKPVAKETREQKRQRLERELADAPRPLSSLAKGAAAGITGLGGDLEGLARLGINYFGGDVSPETALPTSQDMLVKIRGEQAPENWQDRYAEKIGSFAGPGGILGKLFKAPAAATLAGDVGGAVGAQGAEDLGLGPLGQLFGALGGGLAGVKGLGAARSVANDLSAGESVLTNMAARGLSKSGPRAQETAQLAQDLNVTVPPSALTQGKGARELEKFINLSGKGAERFDDLMKNVSDSMVKSYGDILDKVGPKGNSRGFIGSSTQSALANEQEAQKAITASLYDRSSQALPKGAMLDFTPIEKSLAEIETKLAKSPRPSSEEAKALQTVREVREGFKTLGTDGQVPVESVLSQIRSFHDIIDFETMGGAKNMLKYPLGKMKEAIEDYGKTNPEFLTSYKAAQGKAQYVAKTLRNDLIRSITSKEQPELVFNAMSTPSGLKMVEQALGSTPSAKSIFSELKRAKLGEYIDNLAVDQSGKFRIDAFTNALKDPKKNEMIQALMGKENYAQIQKLQKLSSNLKDSSKFLANPSGSGDVAIKFGYMSDQIKRLISGVGIFATSFNPTSLLLAAGMEVTPRLAARIYTNPNLIKKMTELAKLPKTAHPKMVDIKATQILRSLRALQQGEEKEQKSSE